MVDLERKYRVWDKVNRCYIEDVAEIKPSNSNNIVKEYYVCMDMLKKHELYVGDALKNVLKVEVKADVIFIDPPYKNECINDVLENNTLVKI